MKQTLTQSIKEYMKEKVPLPRGLVLAGIISAAALSGIMTNEVMSKRYHENLWRISIRYGMVLSDFAVACKFNEGYDKNAFLAAEEERVRSFKKIYPNKEIDRYTIDELEMIRYIFKSEKDNSK